MKYLIATAAMLLSVPAMAQDGSYGSDDQDKASELGGFRIEGRVGIERPNLSQKSGGDTYVGELGSGIVYGVEVGYDIPVSNAVTVGPYVAFDKGQSDKCETYSDFDFAGEACFKSKSAFSAGVRGAFAIGRSGEMYLGVGYDKYKYTVTDSGYVVSAPSMTYNVSETVNDGGIGVSFGYNHNLSENLYAGLGMRVTEAGKLPDSDISLQRFIGFAAVGARF